jgi:hypothetical protein
MSLVSRAKTLFLEPVGIAVSFPFAEVLLVDRPAAEIPLEDGLDFRQAIEPSDEAGAGDAKVDGTANPVADFVRQASDLTGMRTNF